MYPQQGISTQEMEQMKRMAEMQTSKVVPAQGQFDAIVNALEAAVSGYEDTVQRLNYLLETPRPACDKAQKTPFAPQTVQEAVAHAAERINSANEYLYNIIGRLQEQVGELKILP